MMRERVCKTKLQKKNYNGGLARKLFQRLADLNVFDLKGILSLAIHFFKMLTILIIKKIMGEIAPSSHMNQHDF